MSKTESKHTPGPWRVLEPDQVRGNDGEWICSCEGGKHRLQKDRANARLIAAAPELLEALRQIQVMTEQRKSCIRMPNGLMLGNFCRTAIAKAESWS